ncbi:MAG: C39 family peptidase [Gammaproteobacteria bacterium]|nr:C39 family peptidase [Gammaproteobacteria bacterium]
MKIGIIFIVNFMLVSCVLADQSLSSHKLADQTIPYPPGMVLNGAASYLGTVDHDSSPYYKHPNFYEMKSGSKSSLSLLQHFKTYQQTTEYTCGPAALVMAAFYRGVQLNELEVANAAGTNPDTGTSTEQMVNYLTSTGWSVRSSLTEPTVASLGFLKKQVEEGNPVMVEWVDWAGHWQVIIGYDDMGTPDIEADDVLVMADPYDTTDHLQDGYGVVQADRFQYMWFDHNLLPENQREQQWIIFQQQDGRRLH